MTLAEAYAICGMLIKGGESCAEDDSDGHTREIIFLSAANYFLSDEDIEKNWEFSEDQRFVFLKGLNTTASKIWMYDIPAWFFAIFSTLHSSSVTVQSRKTPNSKRIWGLNRARPKRHGPA